jgi:hypothetical protein
MIKAPGAPYALVDIVCSTSQTTVDVGQCSQCSVPQTSTRKKTESLIKSAASSHVRRSPKNLIVRHTRTGVTDADMVPKACSSNSQCALRIRRGNLGSSSTKKRGCGISVSYPRLKANTHSYNAEGGK